MKLHKLRWIYIYAGKMFESSLIPRSLKYFKDTPWQESGVLDVQVHMSYITAWNDLYYVTMVVASAHTDHVHVRATVTQYK